MKKALQWIIILVTWQVLRVNGTPSQAAPADPYLGSNSAIYTLACVADQIDVHAGQFGSLAAAQTFINSAPSGVGISNLSIKQIP